LQRLRRTSQAGAIYSQTALEKELIMRKQSNEKKQERNRKAADILRNIDKKDLQKVSGGAGDCRTCGIMVTVDGTKV
jgi:hypothetical protein